MSLKFKNQGGSDREISGYDFLSASADAEKYKASVKIKSATLPPKVDLRAFMTQVEDQKSLSSCTANAVAGAYEYLIKKFLAKKAFDVSRLFIYYNARLRAGYEIEDKGSHIQYAVDSLMKIGACKEDTWPYDLKSVNKKPHEESYQAASNFKIERKKFVPIKLETWKQCLAEGYPIVFGTALFSSFDSCTPNKGIVSMPSPDETGRKAHGLHAMLCVGYSDIDKMFIVRNSWGDKWGDKGYCYMPYEYLMNPKFNLGDCWIFGRSTPIPDAEDSWIDNKKSVIDNGKGYDRKDYIFYKESDYSDFDIWEFVDVYEYDEEVTEEYDELEYEGDGEYDDILGEYEEEEEEESDEEEEEEESDEEEEEESDEEEEEEESDEEEEEEESDEEEEEEESDEEEEEEESDEEEEEEESDEEEEESDEDEEEEEEESDEEEEEEEESDEEEEEEESDEEESGEEEEEEK
jgi:C1A family cysteine protease